MQSASDSALKAHARRELELAGLFDKDSDYGGMLGEAVMRLMDVFSGEGHSGASAAMAVALFEKVARYQPLTPLTGADHEWSEPFDEAGTRQNRRCGHVFKRADGSAYDIDGRIFREPNGSCFTSRDSCVDVTFPYTPVREYVDVLAGEP
jgi:hypothetical protein